MPTLLLRAATVSLLLIPTTVSLTFASATRFTVRTQFRSRSPKLTLEQISALVSDAELDDVLDAALAPAAREPIMETYRPRRRYLVRRLRGTMLERTWQPVLANTFVAAALVLVFRAGTASPGVRTPIWRAPPAGSSPWLEQLIALDKVWHYLMTLTTFTLSFFLNQAYSMFSRTLNLGRKIQGRLNDLGMVCAHRARRDGASGALDPAARATLERVARYVRLFSLLFYAGLTRRHAILRSARGLERAVARGALSAEEARALLGESGGAGGGGLPASQRHWIVLGWIAQLHRRALDSGAFVGDRTAAETQFDERVHELRGAAASVGDELADRIPLPYIHFVQILTDFFLLLTPFALFPEMGAWCIVATASLTLFYEGLLNLAKSFIDPLDNERVHRGGICIDTLIAESNAGAVRWLYAATPPLPAS